MVEVKIENFYFDKLSVMKLWLLSKSVKNLTRQFCQIYRKKFGALYFHICSKNQGKMQQVPANFGLKSLEETQDFQEKLQFHGTKFRILALMGTIGHH